MLDFLKGNVVYIDNEFIGLDVNNIGFRIYTSNTKNYKLNNNYIFYVNEVLKEDKILIFGFSNHKELKLFNKIISVNGVGYKTALTLFNNLSIEQLIYLIKSKNSKELVQIPGIGVRAERIVLELSNKLDDLIESDIFTYENVYKALKQIGYKTKEISNALAKIPPNLSDSEATKLAIKEINYGK